MNNKKLSFIVVACLMVLGLTQCKKDEPTNSNNSDNGDRVGITLKLDDEGQRVHLEGEPVTGWSNVVYDEGDVVYVGSDGKYMGYLTYNGTLFTGSINAAAIEGQPLQFVFMGGQDFHASLTENSSTEYTFNIGNQSNGLAVISCAASNENFSATKLDYTAYRHNNCALVKFDLGGVDTDATITLMGMKTQATVSFDGTVTNGTAMGSIETYGTGSTRYAVVLSDQTEVTEGSLSAEGYTGLFSIPTAASSNAFLTDATMTLTEIPIEPLSTPLTLEALTDGTIVVNISGTLSTGMKYSVNGGDKTTITTTTTINVNAGDKVQLYGNGTITSVYGSNGVIFGGTAQMKAYGNIMSLIDETGYASLTTLPNQEYIFLSLFYNNNNLVDASDLLLPATTLAEWCYASMFYGCTSLTAAPALPATTLASYCYASMFQGCTSLTTVPELPATTLASLCYCLMFSGCTSLTTAPELPVTTLTPGCYASMFQGCTSLPAAPVLPATTLAEGCYYGMFCDCTSLTTSPALPATTLAEKCYLDMFFGCTSLSNITCLAVTGINENNSTAGWVNGVASTGTFTKASGATWPTGISGIPTGWTIVDAE